MKKKILWILPWMLAIGLALAAQDDFFKVDPTDPEGDRFYKEFMNMVSTLGLILVGLLILAWVVKRFSKTRLEQINTTSSIKILESRPISNKSSLHLIEVEGTGYLVAEHAQGIIKVGEFELQKEG